MLYSVKHLLSTPLESLYPKLMDRFYSCHIYRKPIFRRILTMSSLISTRGKQNNLMCSIVRNLRLLYISPTNLANDLIEV